jgi:tRNA nucleotidyltransferase (CCA-adding enzyme)
MKKYIVGGYVRDKLLGLQPKDRDWVVVGSNEEQMLNQGYELVGRDFPVFIHPKSKETYSLARTDRTKHPSEANKKAYAHTNVTLEDDLSRRDFTLNAMAMTENGQLIDPFNGQKDLETRIIRHVGSSFRDDPVRVLRAARFAARFGFTIADESQKLIQKMIVTGELDKLVPERVWAELQKALEEKRPDLFISTLREIGALAKTFPEIDALFGIPQPEKYHPEIDTGLHTLLALKRGSELTPDPIVRFGTLLHDLGKGVTKPEFLPRHIGHEKAGVELVEQLCLRCKVPNKYREFAKLCAEYHLHIHRVFELKPSTLLKVVKKTGALKNKSVSDSFLLACQADAQGRIGKENSPYPQAEYFKKIICTVKSVKNSEIIKMDLIGKDFADELHKRQLSAINKKIPELKDKFRSLLH